ncbi:hypothetical protein SteCoe_18549 [Stentor coeruleus]|uniref:Uncharacterized protein n=1 Tax=Stentor coeruleus TaxID=5963 RepID=A0A1R2BW51_9CILI|nr:hypothetical protein SteCoe_18549 [Stentor coeruleus]
MDERLPHASEKQPRSRLARLAGRESDLASTAVLSLNPGLNYSKNHFKGLYKADLKKELEEWDLPFASARNRPTGAILTNTKLPPITYEESNEEDDQTTPGNREFDFHTLTKMLNDSSKPRSGLASGAQETLFVDRESMIFKELKKIITGEDAISFFAKNGNTTPVKFLYCNKASANSKIFRPYDLVVVPEKEIHPEYFTISAQGVVHVMPKTSEGSVTTFYSLADWMHQSKLFNLLTSMKFFKHYLNGKVFSLWRGNVRYNHYCATRNRLKRNLFHAKPVFIESLPKINELLYTMTTCHLLDIPDKSNDLSSYVETQKQQRTQAKKDFDVTMEKLGNECESVKQTVHESAQLPEMEDMDPAKLGQRNKKKSMVQQKLEEKERKHKLQLAEEHKSMLGNYIRLVDYMSSETIVILILDRTKKFYKNLTERRSNKIFTTKVIYGKDCIVFDPNEEEFLEKLEGILEGILSEIGNLSRLTYRFDDILATDRLSPLQMADIIKSSESYQNTRKRIREKFHDDFVEAQAYVETYFEKARYVNDYVETWNFEIYRAEGHTVQQIKDELNKIKETMTKDVSMYVHSGPNNTVKGILNIDGKAIKNHLHQSLTSAQNDLKSYLNSMASSKADQSNQELSEMNLKLSQQPSPLSDFIKYMEDLTTSKAAIQTIESSRAELEEIEKTLRREKFSDSPGTNPKFIQLDSNIKICKTNIDQANDFIEKKKPDMEKKLASRVEKLKVTLSEDLSKKLDEGSIILVEAHPTEALNELKKIETRLKKCENNAEKFKHFQEVFAVGVTRIKELEDTSFKFKSKNKLWNLRKEWDEFHGKLMNDDFLSLGPDLKKSISRFEKESGNLKRELMMYSKEGKDLVAEDFYTRVKEVSAYLPIIECLGIEALKTRHWIKIHNALPKEKEYTEGGFFSLSELIDHGVMQIRDKVEEISATAAGEFSLENTVEEIRQAWSTTNFELSNYREQKDKFYITKVEDTLTQLEDHQVSVQTMLGNRHVAEIKGMIEDWDKKLRLVQDVIDEWLICQKQWMYLENIFSAPDIQKQLPRETTKFQGVDRFWRELMLRTNKNPAVIEACISEGLLDKFKRNNKILEEIKKSLDEYLESKRLAFPRFYFLADEELLEILSQTRNPRKVQDHLRKCFDNMDKIIFKEEKEGLTVTGMISGEHETVNYSQVVVPEGNVEHWLTKIEEMMKLSLYDLTKKAIQVYPKDELNRRAWFFEYNIPAQCLLVVDQIKWTFWATEAIDNVEHERNKGAIKEFWEFLRLQIKDSVGIVRGELTGLQRTLMGALITLDVHGRDVIDSLVQKDVKSLWDFEWSKQLRYYWESDIDDCRVRQTNAKFRYSYEYLGNGPRLVITPLTDKCYLTLTGALHLYYGGAPAGPAGTGKTETTKDLGKALAIQCVVFNCSDGLDVNIMARFFSGLAQAGAWSCFDEFNRIDIEVLSVIAQQILTIQHAVRNNQEEFEFFGRNIKLDKRFGVFITMNPGYAGRTELPDNLKALFRPVAMMIPDYAMIAEIMLFSEGFEKARVLARKMVQLYKLASEQLSKQDHYDFGMRAVKSVLVMAGQLRRKNPQLSEDVILIRAMRDSNVPKFLEQDLPLFRGIITDLFPEVVVPFVDYGNLERSIREQLLKKGLQALDAFVLKIIQLFETMLVRHGNMIVGPAATGKTNLYKTLADALAQLHDEEEADETKKKDPDHQKILYYPLNPKAISMGELYGQTSLTGDFTDGIVPILVRSAKSDNTPAKKWIVFDGPVDSLWIESMNTVLDDNKMLCLTSGERIKLPDTITMLFEVQDLAQASPATVSRCGMVYLDPVHLGWLPLIDSWHDKFKIQLPTYADHVVEQTKKFISTLLPFVKHDCKEEIQSSSTNLVTSCLNLITSLVKQELIAKKRPDDAENLINVYLIFALTWSLGANLNDVSRLLFDKKMRVEIESLYRHFPYSNTVFDYCIDDDMCEFVPWESRVPSFNYNSKQPFFMILVPTVDTVRDRFILEVLAKKSHHLLFSGNTGVGKTVIIKDYLNAGNNDWFVSTVINCSAQTSTQNINDVFEDKLEAPRKKIRRPPPGKKMIMFIDDVNMPALDLFGSQPPIELLRQIIEAGFYDLKNYFFKNVEDVIFVAACAPPGGGRNQVSPRFFRHFNMIWQIQLAQSSMEAIFSSILRGFLDEHPDENLSDHADPIVKTSVENYIKICNDLLPTPSKSHYTFNLRDLSKVVQGMLMISYENLRNVDTLLLLWLHECCRVFRDRLVDDKDRNWFNEELERKMRMNLNVDIPSREKWADIIFGDFMSGPYKEYVKIEYGNKLFDRLALALEQYNSEFSSRMNLVFFKDAINHLTRICRILRQPRGNALLVGVGGSGRQSLARLAVSMAGYRPFSIEITRIYGVVQFREDLKVLLKSAGAQNEQIAFIFSDTQIVKESFLEDINNVLNTGEVPNLYEIQDTEEIIGLVRQSAKEAGRPDTKDAIFQHYVQLCRDNLHIVLAFSPVGEQFRVRCRQFPSIVNCCTLDWYSAWPRDALFSVAQRFFNENEHLGIKDLKDQLCNICVEIHSSVTKKSKDFELELRRKNYTTPTSYLELIKLYLDMLTLQQKKVPEQINKYVTGLKRLKETNEMVSDMQKEQAELKIILKKSSEENARMQIELQGKQADAKVKEEACAKDEADCSVTMKEVSEIKDECQKDLDEALPALNAANRALGNLNKSDIVEIKSYPKPPPGVEMVMNAVCLLFKEKQTWDSGKKLLGDMNFLQNCMNFPKDDISNQTLRKLQTYMANPEFNKDSVAKVSIAAGSLCEWAMAMDKYARISRNIEPKRNRLAQAETNLKVAQEQLNEKQTTLRAIQKEVSELEATFQASVKKGEELRKKSELTEARLDRAGKLVSGLSSESKRWAESAKSLEGDLKNLVGNIMLAAGFVAYLGPFTMSYRNSLMDGWISFSRSQRVPVFNVFSAERILADAVEVREWTLAGLPADQLSIDNAIIVTRGRRWPLIIDPQGQANKWIKTMDRETLKTIKLTDASFLKTLENGIRFGNPILLENVEEKLDPSIDPVLQKNMIKKGGQIVLRLGDQDVPYSNDFRFYMTTKLSNPHYLPEICIKVTIINFTVTPQGLEDQLLVDVVKAEKPQLEELKNKLIVQISSDKDMLQELEDKILTMISKASGDILDDEILIETLGASKKTSEVIHVRMAEAEQTATNINAAREEYRIVAERGSILYFVIADMGLVDPMYQYSLDFFSKLFNLRLYKSQKSDDIATRLQILVEDITKSFYFNICRGLFEKDKMLYSFLNAVRISLKAEKVTIKEWAYFLKGSEDYDGDPLSISGLHLEGNTWSAIKALEEVNENFLGITNSFESNPEKWRVVKNCEDPFKERFPSPYEGALTSFQKLIIGSVLKPEKLMLGLKMFVSRELGQVFIESPPFDLKGAFEDSQSMSPIIFILSPGADPISDLMKLAAQNDMDGRFRMLSLGQGQGKTAEKFIDNGRRNGDWVCLQNCHLAASWMGELERIQEQQVEGDIHPEYRLWLTSMPSSKFPVPVLQSGVKLTNEPPKGLKANLGRTFQDVTQENYEGCTKSYEYKRMLYALAFFHAVILERRKFGAIGWNIPYEWMTSDFVTSKSQLFMYLNEQAIIPYGTLKVLVAEINYGGRVTDDKDVRLITALLDKYFTPELMSPNYTFSTSSIYRPPEGQSLDDIKEYIKGLPLEDDPELFGLHSNANITFNKKTVYEFREAICLIHPKISGGGSGKSSDDIVNEMAKDIEERLPKPMNVEKEQHPDTFSKNEIGAINSLGVFVGQEIYRFNKLLVAMKNSLVQLQKAIRGDVVMGQDLERMYNSFLNQRVPKNWSDHAYPSLKPLGSWVKDLIARVEFIHQWLTLGPRPTYWLSAFFFPQGFMTAALQMYARMTKTPIDTLKFRTEVIPKTHHQITEGPSKGVNIHGLFMQGARWDTHRSRIEESEPGALFIEMPVVWLDPILLDAKIETLVYPAPMYKTSLRAGELSTTGHSTNFVLFLELPTTQNPVHWIRRGVALLCQLDD